jgi:hypothetical protein
MSHADGEQLSDEDEVRALVDAILRWLNLEISLGHKMKVKDWPDDDGVDRLAERLDPRRFLDPAAVLEFNRQTLTLLVHLGPRFPTLDLAPVAEFCHYVLAWNLVGPDERYVPADDVLDQVGEEAAEVLRRATWDLLGIYKVGPLTFRPKGWERGAGWEIVFGAEALTAKIVEVDEATFRFAQEVAAGRGRPVPYEAIREKYPAVAWLQNQTDQAKKLRKALPGLLLRGTREGFVIDI